MGDVAVTPRIDRSAVQDIKVRAGTGWDQEIPVAGEPPPEISWSFKGKPVESGDRLRVETKDYETRFVCKRSVRGDTGVYVIKASNDSGSDTVEVNVTVLDRPGEPEGPLAVDDVHAHGAKLKWKPPADDGGAEVTHYVVEKQDLATGRWTTCGEPAGTEFQVTDLTPGHEYKFRVKAANRYGESDALNADKPITAKNPYDEAGKPGTPDVTDWDKDRVDLKWAPPKSDGGAPIEKYLIEKRTPTGEWEFAEEIPAKGPTDDLTATVKGLKEGQQYQFRVKAINKAGASVPSDPSRTVTAKARHGYLPLHHFITSPGIT